MIFNKQGNSSAKSASEINSSLEPETILLLKVRILGLFSAYYSQHNAYGQDNA